MQNQDINLTEVVKDMARTLEQVMLELQPKKH